MENLKNNEMDAEYWYNEYKKSQYAIDNLKEILDVYHKKCIHLIEERDFYKDKYISTNRNGVL